MDLDRGGKLRKFLLVAWHSVFRYPDRDSAELRDLARKLRVYDEARDFLLGVIHQGSASPEEWTNLFKIDVVSQRGVTDDAVEFWAWLYDGEPVPPPKLTGEPNDGE